MQSSESINELAKALSAAQGEITGALKDSANPFFKSKYADRQLLGCMPGSSVKERVSSGPVPDEWAQGDFGHGDLAGDDLASYLGAVDAF